MARLSYRAGAAAALTALLLGGGLALGGTEASAETSPHHRALRHHRVQREPVGRAPRYAPGTEPYSVQGQIERGCVPWCNNDTNPCDPPNFKQADGRCDFDNQF